MVSDGPGKASGKHKKAQHRISAVLHHLSTGEQPDEEDISFPDIPRPYYQCHGGSEGGGRGDENFGPGERWAIGNGGGGVQR